jgi:hypothetical protein
MILTRWLGRGRRPAQPFRPGVVTLENRTVPSRFGLDLGDLFGQLSPGGPATHLQVVVPESTQPGKSFEVIVRALDASNHLATGYAGTVALSLGTSDPGANLPGIYTFGPNDKGMHEFRVTLSQATAQTITATDSDNSFTASATTNSATRTATSVMVETPETAATGVATPAEVEVLDQSGQLMRNYTGQVSVTSASDSSMTGTASHGTPGSQPITYNFTRRDQGEHTFRVTFNAAVTAATDETVTAATTTSSLSGTSDVMLYPATTVTHLGVFLAPFAFSGTATPVVIEALNASGQVVTGYSGTLDFSFGSKFINGEWLLMSSNNGTVASGTVDVPATISATHGGPAITSYTFAPGPGGDNGKHTFWVTFNAPPRRQITILTVADSAAGLTSTVDVVVYPGRPFFQHERWVF